MNKIAVILILSVFLISCKPSTRLILESGSIAQKDFYQEVAFDFSFGLPIIEVLIEGQAYNFLLDTGASTVLSKDLARKLELNSLKKSKVNGSQGNYSKEDFVILNNLQIGSIDFTEIGVNVSDLKTSWGIKCLNIDGIIGLNLMSKAIWEIDYSTQTIKIASNREKLHIPSDSFVIDFSPDFLQKKPKIDISLNGKTVKGVILDTGFNGSFLFSKKDFSRLGKNHRYIESFGSSSMGIYELNKDRTTIYSKVKLLEIGNYVLTNQITYFDNKSRKFIGNRFLSNFRVFLDWNLNQINLSQNTAYDFSQLNIFGFVPKVVDGKFYVGEIFKNSESEEKGVQINDEILLINNMNISSLTENESCEFLFNIPYLELNEIRLVVRRNGRETEINLKKRTLI